jgi:hypothetical protein
VWRDSDGFSCSTALIFAAESANSLICSRNLDQPPSEPHTAENAVFFDKLMVQDSYNVKADQCCERPSDDPVGDARRIGEE